MTTSMLAIEDPIINWVFDHIPTIGTVLIFGIIAAITAWRARGVFNHYVGRLMKVEYDTSELKNDVKSIKKRVTRIEKKLVMLDRKIDEKVSGIDQKLDKLISYLITTKQVDKDAMK